MKKFIQILQFLTPFIFFAILSCTTSQSKALRKVQVGMDKSDVLEIAGNPERKTREHNQDLWMYGLDNESSSEITYIYFSSGKVSYVGPKIKSGAVKVSPSQTGYHEISK